MLAKARIHPTFVSTDLVRSRDFWENKLGIHIEETGGPGGGLMGTAGGTPFYIYQRDAPPKADHTLASFEVDDLEETMQALAEHGVKAQHYPGWPHDELGIVTDKETGARVAWIKDPDGNIFGLSQTLAPT